MFTRDNNNLISDRILNGNDGIEHVDANKKNLQPVAVKVLHPGIKEQLRYVMNSYRSTFRLSFIRCFSFSLEEIFV